MAENQGHPQTHTATLSTVESAMEVLEEVQEHGGHHLALGRHIEHPPEPPHLIQIWYYFEQEKLVKDYMAKHPGSEEPSVVENWLVKNEQGEWEAVEGQSPTVAQLLHYGPLKKEMPLIGYAPWENHIYFGLAAVVLILFFYWMTAGFRKNWNDAIRRPVSKGQMLVEVLVEWFDDMCNGVLGPQHGRKYLPFIGTLFMLILFCNLMGLIPLMKAPTSSLIITVGLALCTFLVVQGTAWIRLGPLTYIHHLMGSPRDAIGWVLSPLFLALEIISDFVAKPLSLALRLFGNILGKDILLGAFLAMGLGLMAVIWEPASHVIGVPLTIPFYFLGILLSTIQALVFALLSVIYIMLVLPHDHDHDEQHHEEPKKSAKGTPVQGMVHDRVPS